MPQYVSREDYYAAAVEILSEGGFRGLTMTSLHRHLGVSSGSFYNWFRSWSDFVNQFLEHWIGHTEQIARQAAVPQDAMERLDLLRELARTVPHDAEASIRAWGTVDPAVAAAQRTVDLRRLTLIEDAVAAVALPSADVVALAELCLSVVIGSQLMHRPIDIDSLDRNLGSVIDLIRIRAGTSTPTRPPT